MRLTSLASNGRYGRFHGGLIDFKKKIACKTASSQLSVQLASPIYPTPDPRIVRLCLLAEKSWPNCCPRLDSSVRARVFELRPSKYFRGRSNGSLQRR